MVKIIFSFWSLHCISVGYKVLTETKIKIKSFFMYYAQKCQPITMSFNIYNKTLNLDTALFRRLHSAQVHRHSKLILFRRSLSLP